MRKLLLALVLTSLPALADTPKIEIEPAEPNAYTHLNVKNNPRDFQFGIISDRAGGIRGQVFEEGIRKLNLLNPEFIMSVGDGIQGYTEDLEQMHREWDELDAIMAASEVPFFYVPGNHDIANNVMLEEWKKRYGSPYYYFVYQDVLFIILNSEDPPPKRLSEEQLAFVEETLAKHADVRWTLFFLHVPLWTIDHETNWEKLEALVADREYTVFAGHTHRYLKTERQGRRYIVLATTGGGSQLMGPAQGQFDQVAWVTMTDEGPIVANLFLNGIWNENIRTPEVAELIQPLEKGLALQSTPVLVDGDTFTQGESTLTITNPADRPMTIEAWLQAESNLVVSPAYIKREIPANSSETVAITLTLVSAGLPDGSTNGHTSVTSPWWSVAGPHIDYRITYTVEDRDPVEYNHRHQIIIDGPNPCAPVNVTVDGDLAEWPALTNACISPAQFTTALNTWNGPADASFRFATGYDDDFVYIAVHVTDDELLFRDRADAYNKDGVEIRLDARPAATRAASPIDSNDPEKTSDVLYLGVSLGDSPDNTTIYKRTFLPEGVTATAKKLEGGYTIEAAVPVAYLKEKQGADWQDFRLNVTAYDHDIGFSYPRVGIWWRPNWTSPQSYPESGVFVKQ